MNILVTGVPGTGKTEASKLLAKRLGYEYVSINDIVNKYKLFTSVDKKTDSKIVKMKELESYLYNHLVEGDHVVEGHLGCDLDLPIDIVFVLRTNPTTLRKRLEKRKYSKAKVEENVWAELLDYCVINSEERYGEDNVFEVNTTRKKAETTAEEILGMLNKKKKSKHYDWSKTLNTKIDLKKLK